MAIPFRLLCIPGPEDSLAIAIMVCTGPYFLFFCRFSFFYYRFPNFISAYHTTPSSVFVSRGFKLVGPMVIMVYRMLAQDIVRSLEWWAQYIYNHPILQIQVHVNLLHLCHGILPRLLCALSGGVIQLYSIFCKNMQNKTVKAMARIMFLTLIAPKSRIRRSSPY